MDSQTLVFIILFVAATAGFVLALVLNSRADLAEKEIFSAARQAGWKIGKKQFGGTSTPGIDWTLDINSEDSNNTLFWETKNASLKGGVLVIMPRMVLQVYGGKGSKMAFSLTGRGKNWLKPGIKTLQLAIEKSQAVDAGSKFFQQRYGSFSNLPETAEALLTPEIEAMLMDFPHQPGQPFTPLYVILNPNNLQVFAETSLQGMEAYTRMVNLGTAISIQVNTLQEPV